MSQVHRVGITHPIIKITYHRYGQGVGRPGREIRSGHAIYGPSMRTHLLIDTVMFALTEQVKIEVAKN
jgi:hypothetical protein